GNIIATVHESFASKNVLNCINSQIIKSLPPELKDPVLIISEYVDRDVLCPYSLFKKPKVSVNVSEGLRVVKNII
ncbi:hypothetical protein N9L02_03805, partial [Gammaproteobacteria bacterium]|nr:hypothetical protein [Gammaproteobacteria bacterium]